MTPDAYRAIVAIRKCVDGDHYALSVHFSVRMKQRGLFWPDVRAVIDEPNDVRSQGLDEYDRPKWIIRGEAAYGGDIEVVCAIEIDATETEFITLFWDE